MSLKWQLMNCWGKMIKMTKNEYICELYEGLKELDGKIVDDVIDDVEEYFMEGKARGLSEEEVIKELGPASDFVSGLLNQEKELSSSRSLTIKTNEHLYVFDNAAGKIEINGLDHFFIKSDKPYETIENDTETVYSSIRNEGFIFFNFNDMQISLDDSMKNIKVISKAGDVIIRNIEIDTLHAEVNMGSLKLNNVKAERLVAINKMGDVKIDGQFKEADISSGMGDTKISGNYERLNITSGCGDAMSIAQCFVGLSGWCTTIAQNFINAYLGSGYNIYDTYDISYSEAQPGDIIYYVNGGWGMQHYAVYLGNDTALQGNMSGGLAKIGSIYLTYGSEPIFKRLNGR